MKTIILLAIFGLVLMVLTSNAKRLYYDNDNDIELEDEKARMILRSMLNRQADDDDDDDNESPPSRRANNQYGCVKCKFGIFDCCPPDVCEKRLLLPNKCLTIKPGK